MNRWVILFVLGINSTCLCGDSKSIRKDVVLNISNPDPSSIETLTRRPYGLFQTIYRANNGYRLTEVVDGQETLWKAPDDDHSCEHVAVVFDKEGVPTFVFVYFRNDNDVKCSLYYMKENGWVSTTEEKFYKKFHNFVIKESFSKIFVLETAKSYNYREFYVNKSSKFPFAIYAANSIVRLKEVRYEGSIIWNAQNDYDSCAYASFYPRENAKLAYLIVYTEDDREDLYFHNFCGLWTPITRDVYLEELANLGFDASSFDNRVTLDISSVDNDQFHMHTYVLHGNYTRLLTPLPGYRLTRVVIGKTLIWEAGEGECCIYLNSVTENTTPLGLFMFVVDSANNGRILYLNRGENGWVEVTKDDYYNVVVNIDSSIYTHTGDGKLVMSSFKNKDGLRIATYASTVDAPKGDVVLVHGFRSWFMSELCAFDIEWNHSHLDFPGFPHICTVGNCEKPKRIPHVSKYKFLFEYGFLDGLNAFDIFQRYEYDYSLVYFLNRMGYNVYGMDLQSQGLSEGITNNRNYAKSFKDYVHDAIQFVSIVKRGMFHDSSQVYDENLIYKNVEYDRKTFLLGYSMGGNMVIQAVQEFYRNAKDGAKFIDGLIGLSTMLSLDCHLYNLKKTICAKLLGIIVTISPNMKNLFEFLLNYGESFDPFIRYKDPFHYSGNTTFKPIYSLFVACTDVKKDKNMKHYPKDMPTLFVHSKGDFVSGIKGPREFINKHFKGNENFRLIEINDTSHYLTVYQSMSTVVPCLWRWFNGLSGKVVVTSDKIPTYNEL